MPAPTGTQAQAGGAAATQQLELQHVLSRSTLASFIACKCRRGVQLHILSPGMEKRRTNSTRCGRLGRSGWLRLATFCRRRC